MDWELFHHPDLSLPVVRRHATEALLDMAYTLGQTAFHLHWGDPLIDSQFRNRLAYNNATYRLRKRGLVAYRRQGGKSPILSLTPAADQRISPIFRPQKQWERRWKGIWYVLIYDVPESKRPYRAALRGFLKQMHMGCLQGSVWVSPHDIRPEYSDLVKAGGVSDYAFLFEARTVLGQPAEEVVRNAWNFDRLEDLQTRYITVFESNLEQLTATTNSPASLTRLAQDEMAAYRAVMTEDPLLPRKLWPAGYRGPEVYALHEKVLREIAHQVPLP